MDRRDKYCPYCMSLLSEEGPCPSCGLTSGTYMPMPHHLPPGTVLMDRYLVGRVLGEGGFGITYIGCDLKLELKVAHKGIFPHHLGVSPRGRLAGGTLLRGRAGELRQGPPALPL